MATTNFILYPYQGDFAQEVVGDLMIVFGTTNASPLPTWTSAVPKIVDQPTRCIVAKIYGYVDDSLDLRADSTDTSFNEYTVSVLVRNADTTAAGAIHQVASAQSITTTVPSRIFAVSNAAITKAGATVVYGGPNIYVSTWDLETPGTSTWTGAGTWYDTIAVKGVSPKASTLTDTFDSAIDTAKWDVTGTAVWSAGQAALTDNRNLTYSTLRSKVKYDLVDSAVYVKMTSAAYASNRESMLTAWIDANNSVSMFVGGATGILAMRHRMSGSNSDEYVDPYSPTSHLWLRIRLAGTTLYYETSPDATTWTVRRSGTTPLNLSSVTVELACGQWADMGGTSTAYFDNVNTLPAAGTAHPLAGSVAGTTASTGSPAAVHPLAGTLPAVTTAAGTLRSALPLAGAVAGATATAGSPTAVHPLTSGPVPGVSATSGTINLVGGAQSHPLAGLLPAVTTASGSPAARHPLVGALTATTTTAGTITAVAMGGRPDVWTGAAWVPKPGKAWTGSAWVEKPWKRWTGSEWKAV